MAPVCDRRIGHDGYTMKTKFESVDDYLAAQPEPARGILQQVRASIRKSVPDAEESISYNIPTYKRNGGIIIYFAGWKKHFSLYPATERLVSEFRKELGPYEIEKGTIRFPLQGEAPTKLIERIARFRAREAAAKR